MDWQPVLVLPPFDLARRLLAVVSTMNRTIANLIVDLAAAFLFMGMVATGYVMRFPLPPGTNRVLTLWGLTRHQWGNIHFWISLGLLAVIAVHLVLHWKWIVTVVGKKLHLVTTPQPSMVRSGLIVVGLLTVVSGLFALAAQQGVREMAKPLHDLDLPHDLDLGSATASGESGRPEPQPTNAPTQVVSWDDVYSVLEKRCVSCHGPDRQLGGFRADKPADYLGQNNKQPLVIPGNSGESPLIAIVSGARSEMRMVERHQLPETDVLLLRAWIDGGAALP